MEVIRSEVNAALDGTVTVSVRALLSDQEFLLIDTRAVGDAGHVKKGAGLQRTLRPRRARSSLS